MAKTIRIWMGNDNIYIHELKDCLLLKIFWSICPNSLRLIVFFELPNLQTLIRMSVGLFTIEIYANWVSKEELERWV